MRQQDAEYIAQLLLSLSQGGGRALSVAGQAIMELVGDPGAVPTAAARRALGEFGGALYAHQTDAADTQWTGLPQVLPSIASLRASPVRGGHMHLSGYYQRGDQGGGEFFWDAASEAADDGGSVILPTGHVGPGRWTRLFRGADVSVRWFGAKGDGVADDYSAILKAQAYCGPGSALYFPAGVYKVSQMLEARSGTTWRGSSAYAQLAGPASRIVLSADADAVLTVNAQKFTAQQLWIDGGGHATKAAVYFPGTSSCWFCTFSDCVMAGPKLPSDGGWGHVVRIDGTSQVDDCTFERCQFWADAMNGDVRTTVALVYQSTNTNALLNVWRRCSFWGGQYGFEIRAGSATLTDCDFGGIGQYCVTAEPVQLLVERCYSESTGAWFFRQTNYAGGAAPFARTVLRGNMINAEGMGLSLNCKCPVLLEENNFAYYVFVDPVAEVGICRVVARNNSMVRADAIRLFSGAGYPAMVDDADTILANGTVIRPGGNPVQTVVVASPYAVPACANQTLLHNSAAAWVDNLPASPIDNQIVTIKDASGTASPTNSITVAGNGKTIDGAATKTITTAYGSIRLSFNATANTWSVL